MGRSFFELLIILVTLLPILVPQPTAPAIPLSTVEEKPITTVVLLDNGKKQNAVNVSTDKGASSLDAIGAYVDMDDKNKKPPNPKMMSQEEISKRFARALSASPKKPKSFFLYFQPHHLALTAESQKTFSKVLELIHSLEEGNIDVIGHSDTLGDHQLNLKISLKRAKYIASLIEKKNIKNIKLMVKAYGEEDLLIETADNVSEPKNRNVEIYIK